MGMREGEGKEGEWEDILGLLSLALWPPEGRKLVDFWDKGTTGEEARTNDIAWVGHID